MQNRFGPKLVIVLALWLVPALALAQTSTHEADPEDFGTGGGGGAPEAITPIACPGTVLLELDFDLMPGGPTTVGDIQAAFPGTALADITLTPPTAAPGVYNTNPVGRALAGNPDGSLNLFLVDPPSGAFGAMGAVIIDLGAPVSEFGFQIGDWNGPANVNVFDQGAPVGSAQFDVVGAPQVCFASDVPFDQVELTLLPDFPVGNWVVPTLWIPAGTAPTLPGPALALLIVLLLGVSAFMLVRRRTV